MKRIQEAIEEVESWPYEKQLSAMNAGFLDRRFFKYTEQKNVSK